MEDQPKNAFSGAESHILTQLGTVRKGHPAYVLNNCYIAPSTIEYHLMNLGVKSENSKHYR